MNSLARNISCSIRSSIHTNYLQHQQLRGIRVKVLNGNLEQALAFMRRKMQASGIERLIKREQTHHIKNSEKRVLARKNLERKIRSQDLARKLKAILIKKVRGL
ncbi:30S ribosomal protein S21 [Benincasa hispida]|uniref:30S ribosomal protein S21 n=1 Tax=Benincasa hispida TaxID=102211 RepID=UPI0018FF9AE6|nr:30S ribosomal protein S21 [Benincasa hispida]